MCQPNEIMSVTLSDKTVILIEDELMCGFIGPICPDYYTSMRVEDSSGNVRSFKVEEYFRYNAMSLLISNSGDVIRVEETLQPSEHFRAFRYDFSNNLFTVFADNVTIRKSYLNSPDWRILKQAVLRDGKWIVINPNLISNRTGM